MSEKPCYDCEWFKDSMCRMQAVVCPTLAKWEGHQEGRAEMARECLDWWQGQADCYNVNQLKYFDDWLKQKGVM